MRYLFIFSFILIPFCSACGQKDPSKPYKAHIVASTPNGYQLTTVEYSTLTDPFSMEGDIGVILGDAVVDALASGEDIIDPNKRDSIYIESGKTIKLDYEVKSGVIYPKNFDSMALLSLYYNFERTFKFCQENLGLTLEQFGISRIFYAPRMRASSEGTTLEGTMKINAAFLPGLRDFWFFKTSKLEDVPIAMNFGVLAHEFGHSIFDIKFAKKEPAFYNTGLSSNEDELSGINEGIADFFSFVVTNSTSEFAASLASAAKERTLPVSWTYSTLGSASCAGSFYCKGSILASALYEISTTGNRKPSDVGKIVYQAMEDFRTDWQNEKESSLFDYNYFIYRIVAQVSGTEKTDYCQIFQKWFDETRVKDNIGC